MSKQKTLKWLEIIQKAAMAKAGNWALELEADRLGAMLCVAHCLSRGIPMASSMIGITLCFKSAECFEILDAFF